MSDRTDPCSPSEPELAIASDLAHHIAGQAAGGNHRERLWIHAAARLIEVLLSGSATELDFAEARAHLHLVHVAARLAGRGATPPAERVTTPRRGSSKSGCESRRRRAA
jgi:hypothetical protein